MPKLMARKPSIKHPWPPLLRPSIGVHDNTDNVSKKGLYYGCVKEYGVGDAADNHEMEHGDDARSRQTDKEGYLDMTVFTRY